MSIKLSKPTLADIAAMQALAQPLVDDGTILFRDQDEMANTIRSYHVAKNEEDKIVGFAALHVYSPAVAEVRSLIVAEDCRNKGVGKQLVLKLEEEAKALGLKMVLVLTYQQGFFEKLGFQVINKEEIPEHKIWADCIKCKHFPICNEISLIKHI